MKVKQREIVKAFRSLREEAYPTRKKFEVSLKKIGSLLRREKCRITNATFNPKVTAYEPVIILINPKAHYTDDNVDIVIRAYSAFRHLVVTNKCHTKIVNDLGVIKKSVRKKRCLKQSSKS